MRRAAGSLPRPGACVKREACGTLDHLAWFQARAPTASQEVQHRGGVEVSVYPRLAVVSLRDGKGVLDSQRPGPQLQPLLPVCLRTVA